MWCAKEGACWSREAIDTCGEKCTKTSDWCCDEAKDVCEGRGRERKRERERERRARLMLNVLL